MHELYCPSCNSPSPFNFDDYLLMCPFCSATFQVNHETGNKEVFGDHFIVPNTADPSAIKQLTKEWLKRLHHKPGMVDKDFYIIDIKGLSLPLWVVSVEAHTVWKGLVKKQRNAGALAPLTTGYLMEEGQFRRSYRWAVNGRGNICEAWGLARLHKPAERVTVEWDGFPLDSTLSRGRLVDEERAQKSAYDIRKFFEFKFANGLPILGVQVSEQEALRRAKSHIELYHYKLANLNANYLIDYRTELEVAGIQLIHTPFWIASYVYQPSNMLRHFIRSQEKQVIVDGYGKGVLDGQLAIQHSDKVFVNAVVCSSFTILFIILAVLWHPAFYLVAVFSGVIAMVSAFIAMKKKARQVAQNLRSKEESFGDSSSDSTEAQVA